MYIAKADVLVKVKQKHSRLVHKGVLRGRFGADVRGRRQGLILGYFVDAKSEDTGLGFIKASKGIEVRTFIRP